MIRVAMEATGIRRDWKEVAQMGFDTGNGGRVRSYVTHAAMGGCGPMIGIPVESTNELLIMDEAEPVQRAIDEYACDLVDRGRYRDSVLDAIENYRVEGYQSPQSYLECVTFMDSATYHEGQFLKELRDLAYDAPEEVRTLFETSMGSGTLWDDLALANYKGVDLMMESALEHSRVNVNLLLATKDEMNRDLCSITDSFGSAYGNTHPELLEPQDLDNALSYLVNQQGYSIGDVYAALDDAMIDSTFIQSVADEVDNNSSESSSCVCALIATNALTYIKMCEMAGKMGGEIVLPARDCTIGIFDKDGGGGSLLGIEPERDVVIPSELLFDVQAEGAGGAFRSGYTVDAVYGLVSDAWRHSHELRESTEPVRMEDLGAVLASMRVSMDGLSEAKAAEAALGDAIDESTKEVTR